MLLTLLGTGLCLGGVLVLVGIGFVMVVSQSRHRSTTPPRATPPDDRFSAHYQHTVDSCEQEFTQTLKRTFKKG